MRSKKVRGQRKKLDNLLKEIEHIKPAFNYEGEFEHFHVPCGFWLLEPTVSSKVKTRFIKQWLHKTEQLIENKEPKDKFCKIVADIVYPYLWSSQIIIFYSEEYYNSFFERRGPYQTWIPITNRSFVASRNIQTGITEKGYTELLEEDDGIVKSEIWFYGEI